MCLPGFGTKATHKNRAAHRGRGRFRRACGLLSLWQAVCYPVYRMQCVPECALFLPYSSQTIGNGCTRTRIETTMILYKVKQTQTVIFQLAHSFNQRVMDSSSLERTKIPRRIARFLVGFSFFWGSAHFCTLFAHRRESRVFPCIVCILCIVSGTCRGEGPPSCCARPLRHLKAPLGLSLLRSAVQMRTLLCKLLF